MLKLGPKHKPLKETITITTTTPSATTTTTTTTDTTTTKETSVKSYQRKVRYNTMSTNYYSHR